MRTSVSKNQGSKKWNLLVDNQIQYRLKVLPEADAYGVPTVWPCHGHIEREHRIELASTEHAAAGAAGR